jgi:hypothetical protein
METTLIPLIIDRLDKIVYEGRIRKFSRGFTVKIVVILQIYSVSYKSSKYFFHNHSGLGNHIGIHGIPNFLTLSYRSRRIDWHDINAGIVDLIEKIMRILPLTASLQGQAMIPLHRGGE